jgi:endonuclease G
LEGVGMKIYLKNSTTSIDYLYSQITKIDYVPDNNINANWTKVGESMWTNYPEAWRLEYPQVSYNNLSPTKDGAETKNQIIVKSTNDFGITYSLEWDNALVANRWTCYELHAGNSMATVGRNDDFKQDPEVAVSSTLDQYSGSGFSRGHLCPSADRLCSTVQNKQTFFLTNMQPQYQSHNGGLWSRLETLVRDYATNDEFTALHCDTLYIVKAATIANVTSDALTGNSTSGVYATSEVDNYNKLLVPRYFYMALLHYNKDTDTYHAIAFWTKHLSNTQPVANLADYAISIDKLEQLTGLDFFCNLPDIIEDEVEAQEPDLDFWKKISKSGSE